MKCEYCENEHDGSYGKGRFCSKQCQMSFVSSKKRFDLSKIDWKEIQQFHDEGLNFSELPQKCGISSTVLGRGVKEGLLKRNPSIYKMNEEARKRASSRMKEMRSKGIGNLQHRRSVPCEKLKSFLIEKGLSFEEEYMPVKGRLFRIDIAFPDLKIGIEVNGNQHYEADGRLTPYYQNRHDLIVEAGWNLIELHYTMCYNETYLNAMIEEIWVRIPARPR